MSSTIETTPEKPTQNAERLKVAVAGMGLIGGSLFKAACRAGYEVRGFDRNDSVDVADSDLILVALPPDCIVPWIECHRSTFKRGAIVTDTCGVKKNICAAVRPLLDGTWHFVGGHPMAGREQSGFAFSDANLFRRASMILTPYADTDAAITDTLVRFFSALGFADVLTTTPEHHDEMIAFTSQLSHIIASTYVQDPLAHGVSGYTAGSYANMTRVASMNAQVWEELFSENRASLLEITDRFLERMTAFRNMLAEKNSIGMREYISNGTAARNADGVKRQVNTEETQAGSTFGHHLKLTIYGASHAPVIGMRLEHFPAGFCVNMEELHQFMERRAPGRNALSTARKEPDLPEFISGLNGVKTNGEKIEAVIRNTDVRSKDYGNIQTVPRPGHADYPQWVRTGKIPAGGGANSGRMTAAMCIAGGICRQWLNDRGITVTAKVTSVGGRDTDFENSILAAKNDGDSIGGIISGEIQGLPPGLGDAMFNGIETELSAALFGIPGVKGVEFGAGFKAAAMRGSENNDAFTIRDGRVETTTNHHGGLLGGMTTGMPLTFRIAMKPTPSIYHEQNSVDLTSHTDTKLQIKGRHDPCIAFRAVPVAEAMAAFVLADAMLTAEDSTPRICLTLTSKTLAEDLKIIRDNRAFIDMAELRVDHLAAEECDLAVDFPVQAQIRTILTIRRKQDGGVWDGFEDERAELFAKLLQGGHFSFVDFEEDFHREELEEIARENKVQIIRSMHDFNGPVTDIINRCRSLKGSSEDIPKIAFKVNHCSELTQLFRETAGFTGFPHILCAMGNIGISSRILAGRTHSCLTFVSPQETVAKMSAIGHLTPAELITTYNFRNLTAATELYAVTGWPLEHTSSPELNNNAFYATARDAVMVPVPAETPAEALAYADALGVRAMAVTVPHKETIIPLLASIDPFAKGIGAVNTVIRTAAGWKGFNTDAPGFTEALLKFVGAENIEGRKVALIGAGGAAHAVAYALAQMKADCCVFSRNPSRAESVAKLYQFQFAALAPESEKKIREYADIIIQATPLGLGSNNPQDDPLLFYPFSGREYVYDLIYAPAMTPLLRRAKAAGCATENGMSMLIEQARVQRRLYDEHLWRNRL